MKTSCLKAALLLICLSIMPAALADSVWTSDGSKLVGKIEILSDNKLVLNTAIAGTLELDAAYITAIRTAEPVTVELKSGDRLVGTLVDSPESEQPFMHTALGDLPFSPGDIVSLWPAGAESPEMAALKAEYEEQVKETEKAYQPQWASTLEAGGVLKDGNTDTLDARGKLVLSRKTANDFLRYQLMGEYGEEDDRRTKNEIKGGLLYENNFAQRWSWYTRLALEFDEFENLDLRSTVAAGLVYRWIEEEDVEFKTRAGVGYRHESYDTGDTADDLVVDLGLDLRKDFAPWLRFTHSTTFSPSFEDFGDYRLDVDTAAAVPLGGSDRWKLKFGMLNEYNSKPQPGLEKLDNTYYVNILWDLISSP